MHASLQIRFDRMQFKLLLLKEKFPEHAPVQLLIDEVQAELNELAVFLNSRSWNVIHISGGKMVIHQTMHGECSHKPHIEGDHLVAYCPETRTKFLWTAKVKQ